MLFCVLSLHLTQKNLNFVVLRRIKPIAKDGRTFNTNIYLHIYEHQRFHHLSPLLRARGSQQAQYAAGHCYDSVCLRRRQPFARHAHRRRHSTQPHSRTPTFRPRGAGYAPPMRGFQRQYLDCRSETLATKAHHSHPAHRCRGTHR